MVASPRQTGHRARIKLAIDGDRIGYREARSHTLVDVDVCGVARPEIQRAHAHLRHWVREHPTDGLDSVELRSDSERVVHAFAASGSVPRAVREAIGTLPHAALNGKRYAGEPSLILEVLGHRLNARARSFFQVNHEANALLVSHARGALQQHGAERVLDLYAGIGNLSVPIAALGLPVVAVEAPGSAAEDLRENAAQVADLTAVARRVERFDTSRVPFDAVVLDPPRTGARGILSKVQRNRPRTVVYVSCYAPSAARDARELKGYTLASLTCFDLFVDTHHIEAVAVFTRRE